jgi:hypothetical protein
MNGTSIRLATSLIEDRHRDAAGARRAGAAEARSAEARSAEARSADVRSFFRGSAFLRTLLGRPSRPVTLHRANLRAER